MPKSTTLVTFCQFMLVSLEGLFSGEFVTIESTNRVHPSLKGYIPKEVMSERTWLPFKLVFRKTTIPLYHWFAMVILFWSLSMMNNLAFNYRVEMPLHIVFKSGGLLMNMFMGWLLLSKRYTTPQVISVLMVSVGVMLSTYASAFNVKKSEENAQSLHEWLTGIALLSTALLMTALLGLYQEHTYKKYGKNWREGLFYTHFLGMPFFLFTWHDIYAQAVGVCKSDKWLLFEVVSIPRMWAYVFVNAATQYICISGVHRLTSVSTSLTVNLVLTFRKFVSLLISVYYFNSHFGFGHLTGTALVFVGTLLYSYVTSVRTTKHA